MTIYKKIDGQWTEVQRPYVRKNNVYYPAQQALVKRSGVWTEAWRFDYTPSAPPELSLQIVDNRYIKVGLRLPGNVADPELNRIRLLASRTQMPTTQFGAGFINASDNDWPLEEWSDWYYNVPHKDRPIANADHGTDTTAFTYKQFPVNPTSATNLPGGQFYYFAAWSEDKNGNWSAGVYNKIWMPKQGVTAPKIIIKEAPFQPARSGVAGVNGANYVNGDLVVRDSPRGVGWWFYNSQFIQAIGQQGAPTIRTAKIRITRGDDTGQANANVRLFWHGKIIDDMPIADSEMKNTTLIGTIGKGETKWFDIPASHYSHFNTEIKGFGLASGVQASDALTVVGLDTDLRCGEVDVVWEEAL